MPRIEYQFRFRDIVTAGHDKKVYGDRVEPGFILVVLTSYLHMPDSHQGDVATITVENGPLELEIRSRARDAAKQGMSSLNPYHVWEYQRVVGHSPDSDIGDELCLTVIGQLMTFEDFRSTH